jgi:hypothetical protein
MPHPRNVVHLEPTRLWGIGASGPAAFAATFLSMLSF